MLQMAVVLQMCVHYVLFAIVKEHVHKQYKLGHTHCCREDHLETPLCNHVHILQFFASWELYNPTCDISSVDIDILSRSSEHPDNDKPDTFVYVGFSRILYTSPVRAP